MSSEQMTNLAQACLTSYYKNDASLIKSF